MTGAEYKQYIKNIPDDAIIAFRVWLEDGAKYYESQAKPGYPVHLHEGQDGKVFAEVAYADNCIAHTLYKDWQGEGSMLRFYEKPKREVV